MHSIQWRVHLLLQTRFHRHVMLWLHNCSALFINGVNAQICGAYAPDRVQPFLHPNPDLLRWIRLLESPQPWTVSKNRQALKRYFNGMTKDHRESTKITSALLFYPHILMLKVQIRDICAWKESVCKYILKGLLGEILSFFLFFTNCCHQIWTRHISKHNFRI